jgi:NTP pyrophosphatase (non-canonical NTP hydrolase)
MNLDDYQRAALRTINPALSDRDRLLDASAGLAEESAELLGQQRDVDEARLIEELGDTLWCLAVAANSLGISLSNVAAANLSKLADRHPKGFSTGYDSGGYGPKLV